eukprot:7129182-Lingulodinium_polyedra.AAC.1
MISVLSDVEKNEIPTDQQPVKERGQFGLASSARERVGDVSVPGHSDVPFRLVLAQEVAQDHGL